MIPYFDLTICNIVKTNNCIYSFDISLGNGKISEKYYFDIL